MKYFFRTIFVSILFLSVWIDLFAQVRRRILVPEQTISGKVRRATGAGSNPAQVNMATNIKVLLIDMANVSVLAKLSACDANVLPAEVKTTVTDSRGQYSFRAPAGRTYRLIFCDARSRQMRSIQIAIPDASRQDVIVPEQSL